MFKTASDPLLHATGLTKEGNCTWCEPGKYQTGVGMAAEVNCTWCAAGKYQTGAGLELVYVMYIMIIKG